MKVFLRGRNVGTAFVITVRGAGLALLVLAVQGALGQATRFAWAKSAGGSQEDYALGLALDSSTNVWAGGEFDSQTVNIGGAALLHRNSSYGDAWMAKFDSQGNVLWAANYGTSTGGYESRANGVATDSSGNVYLTGFFNGPVVFGGTTLSSDGVEVFVAKLNSQGTPVWATKSTGLYGGYLDAGYGYDIAVDSSNNAYVTGGFANGYSHVMTFGPYTLTNLGQQDFFLVKVDPSGNVLWANSGGGPSNDYGFRLTIDGQGNVYALGDFTSTSAVFAGTVLTNRGGRNVFLAKYDATGNLLWARGMGGETYDTSTGIAIGRSNHVVLTVLSFSTNVAFGNLIMTNQNGFSGDGILAEYDQAGNAVALSVLPFRPQGISSDAGGNLFLSGTTPSAVAKYSPSQLPLWSATNAMGRLALDGQRNVYVAGFWQSPTLLLFGGITLTNAGLDDFYVAKLIQLPPAITVQPTNQLVLIGAVASFSVAVTGAPMFSYQWQVDGTNLAGATSSVLSMTNCQLSNAGTYSVTVTNDVGTTNSQSALLDVRYILVRGNGQLLGSNQYSFPLSVTVTLETGFTNGSIFYTLDGTEPSFASSYYSGSFVLSNTATLRAITYSADFSQYGESAPLTIRILHYYNVTTMSAGGGSVTVSPASGPYLEDTVVQIQAAPAAGWTFLQWLGDANGVGPTADLPVTGNIWLQGVFGTTLGTTVAGNGAIQQSPAAAFYPYGTVVQLSAVPHSGNYFAVWGNAASGNPNPLYFAVTNANPTISSLFAALGASQVALSVIPSGKGKITVSPRANAYNFGASVTLTATADAGQSFSTWSGDASGSQNPLNVTMDQSKVIIGNFTTRPTLVAQPGLGGLTETGFRFALSGQLGAHYRIDGTTNFADWQPIFTLTNAYGVTQLTDPAASSLPARFYRAALLP